MAGSRAEDGGAGPPETANGVVPRGGPGSVEGVGPVRGVGLGRWSRVSRLCMW